MFSAFLPSCSARPSSFLSRCRVCESTTAIWFPLSAPCSLHRGQIAYPDKENVVLFSLGVSIGGKEETVTDEFCDRSTMVRCACTTPSTGCSIGGNGSYWIVLKHE